MIAATAVPPAAIVLFAAVLQPVLGRRAAHAVGTVACAAVVVWAALVPAGAHLHVAPLGFDGVFLYVDGFSRLMGIIFGLIGTAAMLYAFSTGAGRHLTAYALAYVGTSLGAVFAGDWLTLVIFWELMAVTSTLLVWDHRGRAVRAGFRYAVFHALGGSLLMAGAIWHYVEVGSFLFDAAAGIAPGLPAVLAALGIGVNVGFVGLHTWLPDTYPSPHVAASVFLSVYTTKTGVYAMARAFPDGSLAVAYMGGAMAVFGVTYALVQHDMRRLLAYHIQSQVGYMVAGVGIGTALATAGAMAHVYNHILYKALLFMTVGVVISRTGHNDLRELGGLARAMPYTALAFAIAALSIAGFPGFNGFVSKGMVVSAAHEEHLEALRWLLLLAAVGTYLSFLKLGYYVFANGDADTSVRPSNAGQRVAMLSIAGLCILYGVYPDALFAILPGTGAAEAHPFTLDHLAEGVVLAAIGLVGFVALRRPLVAIRHVWDVDVVYSPVVFYGGRTLVRVVTDGYAAADRLAVASVDQTARAIRVALRIADVGFAAVRTETPHGEPVDLSAHVSGRIGVGVFVLTLVLGIALAIVLV